MNSSKIKKLARQIIASQTVDSVKIKTLKELTNTLKNIPLLNDELPIEVEVNEIISKEDINDLLEETRTTPLGKKIHHPSAEYVIEDLKTDKKNSKTTFTINWVPDFYDSEEEFCASKKTTKKASDNKEFTLEEILKAAKKMLNMKEDDLIKAFQNSGYYKDSSDLVIESVERKSDLMFAGYKTALLQVVYLVGSYDKSVENEPNFGKIYVQWDGEKISADY